MWHFCVCFGQSPACNAGHWDAASRSRPDSRAPVLTQVSQTGCVLEMRPVEYPSCLDPGLCDCFPMLERQSGV